MICRRGARSPAPTHRPRLKNAAHAKASGPGARHFQRPAAHLRHQAALAPGALPPRPEAPPVPQVITATRSPRSGRRPSHFPQSARRRRRLPGGAGLAPRSRSPPAPRRCGEQPRRPIRLDLRSGSPPLQFPPLKSLFPPPPSAKARWIVVCAPVLKAGRE